MARRPSRHPLKPCECGCGTMIPSRNADGRQMRFVVGHHTRKSPVDYVIDGDGCWVWQGALAHGYGNMRRKGRNYLAHRVYYETYVGPIPEGLDIDHLCRNPKCVNPAHLEPVTRAENNRRRPCGPGRPASVRRAVAA